MNSFQKKAFAKLWVEARAADPEARHIFSAFHTPAVDCLRCTCGWVASETRYQNAYARKAKLFAAQRKHLLEIVKP